MGGAGLLAYRVLTVKYNTAVEVLVPKLSCTCCKRREYTNKLIGWPVTMETHSFISTDSGFSEGMPPRQRDLGAARTKSKIRPLPHNLPSHVSRVRLCDRRRSCKGPVHCTFPHNQQEMDQWNRELQMRRGKSYYFYM